MFTIPIVFCLCVHATQGRNSLLTLKNVFRHMIIFYNLLVSKIKLENETKITNCNLLDK